MSDLGNIAWQPGLSPGLGRYLIFGPLKIDHRDDTLPPRVLLVEVKVYGRIDLVDGQFMVKDQHLRYKEYPDLEGYGTPMDGITHHASVQDPEGDQP